MNSTMLGLVAVIIIWLSTVAWMIIVTLRVVYLNHKVDELLKGYADKPKNSPDTTEVERGDNQC